MDFQAILFWVLAILTGVSAIGVVVTQNIVRCAVFLLFTLAGVSGIFFLIGADFVGATQLFVYVGGTLVLVVFGVMLTAQGPFITMKAGAMEWFVATVVGLLLYTVLALSTYVADWRVLGEQNQMNDVENSRSSAVLGAALLSVPTATPEAKVTGWPEGAGKPPERKRVGYLLPFEIVSVHLLVVLIGAAYLARAKRRKGVPT
jgi:NADH-quinone oxidoreductase subunit J